MASKTRAKILGIGEVLGSKASEFTFLNPPTIQAPNTEILTLQDTPRTLPDPSKTLKLAMGVERVPFKSISEVNNEKGLNGEKVYSVEDPRVRLVGSWVMESAASGTKPTVLGNEDGFIEVTFYGTGLDLLFTTMSSTSDIRITVDNGVESANIFPSSISTVLDSRGYRTNHILNVASGLTLDLHTIKIRQAGSTTFRPTGVEILNQQTQITVPQGSILAAGNKLVNGTEQSIDYNSEFDGSPTLNGKGGRVLVYITPEGRIKKAIQQAENTQLNLSSADHANESVIKRINWRKFGVNRSDDFSTLNATDDNVFTLEDGSTTLVGDNVNEASSALNITVTAGTTFISFMFVGTGLDLEMLGASDAAWNEVDVSVDGSSIGTLTETGDETRLVKIVSGLAYTTHVVKMDIGTLNSANALLNDFIVYGPKKPEIEDDAQEIGEYYLMADFVANTTEGLDTISQGVLRAVNQRGFIYGGSGWSIGGLNPPDNLAGLTLNNSTNGSTVEFTFFGTGFDFRFKGTSTGATNVLVEVDGQTMDDTNYPSVTKSIYGPGTSFTSATGVLNTDSTAASEPGCGLVISGLDLDVHTVRFTRNAGGSLFAVAAIDVITPVHFPNIEVGSLSMGPGTQLQEDTDLSGVDLGKAKAWLVYDQQNDEILAQHNISAVIEDGTSFIVYFDKSFKNENYAVAGLGALGEILNIGSTNDFDVTPQYMRISVKNDAGGGTADFRVCLVFFGELSEEE